MKPLHLNLASRPYRDDRPFYAAVIALSALVAFLLINNIQTAVEYFSATRTTRGEINSLEQAIAAEEQKTDAAANQIRKLNLALLNRRVAYVNSEIITRAFSWSDLLDSLERVLPPDVKIVSLSPSMNKDGTTSLRLDCVAKNTGGLIRLLDRLLADPAHFSRPFPNSESESTDGMHTFSIEVEYKPSVPLTGVGR